MKAKVARFVLALVLALSALGISSSAALADTPVKYDYIWYQVNTLAGVCAFDVTVYSTVDLTETDFYDQDGNLTMIHLQGLDQDTFTANGKTLVGEWFPVYTRLYLDSSGNPTKIIASGLSERIELPDGTVFLSAGWTNFMTRPGVTFSLSPDKGNPGNVEGFCAALAPQ